MWTVVDWSIKDFISGRVPSLIYVCCCHLYSKPVSEMFDESMKGKMGKLVFGDKVMCGHL